VVGQGSAPGTGGQAGLGEVGSDGVNRTREKAGPSREQGHMVQGEEDMRGGLIKEEGDRR